MISLQKHLEHHLPHLHGDWVQRRSSYEAKLSSLLGMHHSGGRYCDAKWNNQLLEFKKGRSIWLDLVRYSEILLKSNEAASQEILTLFFIPDVNRERIVEIFCVETISLLTIMRLTETSAETLLALKSKVPHALNAQASLTRNDLKKIQMFSVCSTSR